MRFCSADDIFVGDVQIQEIGILHNLLLAESN